MSTKIYNAYKMSTPTLTKFHDFVQTLQQYCFENINHKLFTHTAQLTAALIDQTALNQKYPELSRLKVEQFDQWIKGLYKKSIYNPEYILKHYDKIDPNKIPPTREKTYGRLAWDVIIQNSQIASVTQSPYGISQNNTLIIYTMDDHQMAFQAFGYEITELMEQIVYQTANPRFMEFQYKYQIQDFHYQDQTDQPENITETEWNQRRITWEKLMPSGIPSKDGINIQLTSPQMNQISSYQKGFYETVLQQIPTKDKRCDTMAKDLTLLLAIERQQTPKDQLLPSDIIQINTKIQDIIKTNDHNSTYCKSYKDILRKLQSCIPEITSDQIRANVPIP